MPAFRGSALRFLARFTALGDEIRNRDFAAHAVRRGCDRGFGNALLLFQKFLDLPGINIEAAGNNQIALAAAQRVVAIGRASGQIAGAKISGMKAARVASSRRQ